MSGGYSMRVTIFFAFLFSLSNAVAASGDEDRYAEVDRYALAAPASATHSIDALSRYLTAPFTRDDEKARAIFRWITDNISYDVEGYFSKRFSVRTGDVLQSRSSVCAGYSSLFEALGSKAGLAVVTVNGYGKGFSYNPGDQLTDESKHAWNAVKIDGEWRLIDCTWGAGKVDVERRYRKEFEPYYFFAKPEEFIFRHFPSDAKWQLLPMPLTLQQFLDLPLVTPVFFQCRMSMAGRDSTVLNVQGEYAAELTAPSDVLCTANLERNGRVVTGAAFLQRTNNLLRIRILPPEDGEYYLNVFAGKVEESEMIPLAVSFKVVARTSAKSIAAPKTFKAFQETNTQLLSPLNGCLPSGSMEVFSLISPGATKMAVVCGNEWDYLRKNGDRFEGTVEITSGTMTVYAQFPGERQFQALLEYTGTGTIRRAAAPTKFGKFVDSGAEIFSPLKKELPAGSSQEFRMRVPAAKKVAIVFDNRWHFLEQDGDTFEGTIVVGAGRITVVGGYDNTTNFQVLLEYEGK